MNSGGKAEGSVCLYEMRKAQANKSSDNSAQLIKMIQFGRGYEHVQ
jgi:hypothetical protein